MMKNKKIQSSFCAVILAAGEGVRMCSARPKVLHTVGGYPLIGWVIRAALGTGIRKICVVLGRGKKEVVEFIRSEKDFRGVSVAVQKQQKGSGHALLQTKSFMKNTRKKHCLVLCGDTPLLTSETLQMLIEEHINTQTAGTVLSAKIDNPFGYGRIIRNDEGRVRSIVEEKDASEQEKSVKEINTGVYCFDIQPLISALLRIRPDNAKKEFYLTDAMHILRQDGSLIGAVCAPDADESRGINSRVQLAEAEKTVRMKVLKNLMESGVTVIDPENTYVQPGVTVGKDTVLLPGTMLEGNTKIGSSCTIGPFTVMHNAVIENNVSIKTSYIYDSRIRADSKIGPFAQVRPGSDIGPKVKIGNFVEVKKSRLKSGVKAGHLAYIGDADVHEDVNIGAGAITCNYDGVRKHKITIGRESFIGSNVSLVAPVVIGSKSLIGAGSTITDNVPSGKLAIARGKQVIKNKKKQ